MNAPFLWQVCGPLGWSAEALRDERVFGSVAIPQGAMQREGWRVLARPELLFDRACLRSLDVTGVQRRLAFDQEDVTLLCCAWVVTYTFRHDVHLPFA